MKNFNIPNLQDYAFISIFLWFISATFSFGQKDCKGLSDPIQKEICELRNDLTELGQRYKETVTGLRQSDLIQYNGYRDEIKQIIPALASTQLLQKTIDENLKDESFQTPFLAAVDPVQNNVLNDITKKAQTILLTGEEEEVKTKFQKVIDKISKIGPLSQLISSNPVSSTIFQIATAASSFFVPKRDGRKVIDMEPGVKEEKIELFIKETGKISQYYIDLQEYRINYEVQLSIIQSRLNEYTSDDQISEFLRNFRNGMEVADLDIKFPEFEGETYKRIYQGKSPKAVMEENKVIISLIPKIRSQATIISLLKKDLDRNKMEYRKKIYDRVKRANDESVISISMDKLNSLRLSATP